MILPDYFYQAASSGETNFTSLSCASLWFSNQEFAQTEIPWENEKKINISNGGWKDEQYFDGLVQ